MTARRLTVVQILPRLDAGGVERGTIEVAAELIRRGHRAIVVSAGGRMVEELTGTGAEHVTLPVAAKSPLTLRAVRPLRRLLRDSRADIIHARSRVPAWVARFAWQRMPAHNRPRFVTTVHGLYSVSAYSAVMTKGDAVIAVSNAAKKYVTDNYPKTPAERLRVIERGVDPIDFPHGFTPDPAWLTAWNHEYPQLANEKLITVVGRLTRLKGHAHLIELVRALRETGIPACGLIVGGEDPKRRAYAQELRDSVHRAGLNEHITFTGHRNDVREIASISDLVLSLSTKPESFGRTVLEALRLGTPVLGWDHGGVGEILENIYPQGAISLGDTAALASRAADFLSAPKHLVPPSTLFTKQAMLDQTIALYEELTRD